ncbi:GHMP kinase [Trypanosoma melophagium]|uniref:GHMP kinase n=1 Tax=Trypanosoma melophagium TaxID=715481 RepID=UPI00351A877B|nr:GHMP kinase [Trypanosoma melophagium]
MEITLLIAIPAGSGLGTSSLVASTVLSALSDFCGLCWDAQEVGRRTLCQQALDLHDAITRGDFERYGKLIGAAWDQNKCLDAGTCLPSIAGIISRIEKYVWGLELAGTGGGGYLYMVAKDVEAARRIRAELTLRPPNETVRFVEMTSSHKGIQVSRS